MLAKILAVMAATLLVGSIAVATLGPQDITLGEALNAFDHLHFASVEAYVRTHVSAWLWERPVTSLLVRPPWLLPAAIGVLLAGAAMTTATSQKAPNSRRRRS